MVFSIRIEQEQDASIEYGIINFGILIVPLGLLLKISRRIMLNSKYKEYLLTLVVQLQLPILWVQLQQQQKLSIKMQLMLVEQLILVRYVWLLQGYISEHSLQSLIINHLVRNMYFDELVYYYECQQGLPM